MAEVLKIWRDEWGTLPTAEILSDKNGRAWVLMVLYLKIYMKIKILKQKKPGSRLEVAC